MTTHIETYFQTDEPAATVSTADGLSSLAILSEVHVKMLFKLLLANRTVIEPASALLALGGQAAVKDFGDPGTLSEALLSKVSYSIWQDSYLVTSELVNLIFVDKIDFRYARRA